MSAPRAYSSGRRRLVLAFDIGTTYSGISYSILDPGQIPEIKGVTRFPAHEQISGASKIPTVMYYNRAGKVTAAGAEAIREGIYEMALDEGWVKTEWFKLHIRSKRGTSLGLADKIPPLPPRKTVVQVLADFMKYLFQCAAEYIQDTHANGRDLWKSVEKEIDYVISHPNGWEGYQQTQIREAIVLAGLVGENDKDSSRVCFVTEGEASLHFAINNGLPTGALTNGDGVVIVDAGGGTVDVSAYRKKTQGSESDRFEEIAVPQCHFHGSIFVSIHARIFLDNLLAQSAFIDDLDHIVQRFDSTTKLRFRSDKDPQYVRFGGNRDNDETCGIRYGQMKISGEDVAKFFQASIKCITDAVLELVKDAHNPIKHVILVGGFSANDWLYSKVNETLIRKGFNVIRPENYVNKAVSDGAISFYLNRVVRTRVSKFAYGPLYSVNYDPHNPEHKRHEASTYVSAANRKRIRGSFKVMISKNVKVVEKKEYRSQSIYRFSSLDTLKGVHTDVWCYRGNNPTPQWKDDEPDMYSKLCTIVMDLSHIPYRTLPKMNDGTGVYYEIEYDYILYYSGLELKAQMAWMEKGVEQRSPAIVVYDAND